MRAVAPDNIATSNAGDTTPVISSPVPRARNITATITANINTLSIIAEYFTVFINVRSICMICSSVLTSGEWRPEDPDSQFSPNDQQQEQNCRTCSYPCPKSCN